jgi:hypothetical protein
MCDSEKGISFYPPALPAFKHAIQQPTVSPGVHSRDCNVTINPPSKAHADKTEAIISISTDKLINTHIPHDYCSRQVCGFHHLPFFSVVHSTVFYNNLLKVKGKGVCA